MKNKALLFLLFFYAKAFSQVTIKNISLVKLDTNIMYQELNNWIKVSGTNSNVNLISKNGNSVSRQDKNTFIIIPKTLVSDTLLVYLGKKLLLRKIYLIDTFSLPKIQLGNIQSDTASISEILANKGLRGVIRNCLYDFPIRIVYFSTTFLGQNGDTLSTHLKAEGNLLSKDQETVIRSLKRNCKIVFYDIAVVTAMSRSRIWPPFTIVIK
jgi:hypothetical protein